MRVFVKKKTGWHWDIKALRSSKVHDIYSKAHLWPLTSWKSPQKMFIIISSLAILMSLIRLLGDMNKNIWMLRNIPTLICGFKLIHKQMHELINVHMMTSWDTTVEIWFQFLKYTSKCVQHHLLRNKKIIICS